MSKKQSLDLISLASISLATVCGARMLIQQDLHPARGVQHLIELLRSLSGPQSVRFAQIEPGAKSFRRTPAQKAQVQAAIPSSAAAIQMIQSSFALGDSESRMIRYSEATGHAFVPVLRESGERVEVLVKVDELGLTQLAEVPHDPGAWIEFSPGGHFGVVLSNKPRETSYFFQLDSDSVKKLEFVLSSSDYVTEDPQFSRNGEYLVVWTSAHGLVHLVESRTGRVRKLNEAHQFSDKLVSLGFTPDNEELAVTVEGSPGLVRLISLRDERLVRSFELSGLSRPVLRGFSSDGESLEMTQGSESQTRRSPASAAPSSKVIRVHIKTGAVYSAEE